MLPMRAFHDDIELKKSIRSRLEADLSRHAIESGDTVWTNERGSLAASLLRTAKLARGPELIGVPQSILALLDHFGSRAYIGIIPIEDIARRFMDAARPGADLGGIADRLIERMAAAFRKVESEHEEAPDYVRDLEVLLATQDSSPKHVAAIFDQWLHARSCQAMQAAGWSQAQEAGAQETLNKLWDETERARRAGGYLNYPELFAQRDPEMAAGYARGLKALNQSYAVDFASLAEWFFELVDAA